MATGNPTRAARPIGIFDSGIGGLTVADAICRLMPHESVVYFGDTAHLPYGDKSPEAIKKYAIAITGFLLSMHCKAIVIACNTASAVACNVVKKQAGSGVPVINVIDPVVNAIAQKTTKGKIGVIGTKATIRSDIYARKIHTANKALEVASLATPLLAPMIEEGFFNNKISRTIINSYLSKPALKNISSLILACTHYPLIKKEIEEYYPHKLYIIDSAQAVAEHTRKILSGSKLLNTSHKPPGHRFFVSDLTPAFAKSTRFFFKGPVRLKRISLEK